jgi:hypothetical protein
VLSWVLSSDFARQGNTRSSPEWQTTAAGVRLQTVIGPDLAELVRDELRGPVSELVRQVVRELVQEQLTARQRSL